MPSVFFSYSHADEALRDQVEKHLAMLKREGVIETWHDRRILPGTDLNAAIDQRINQDDIVLLLVSPDFINSDYCYDIEMKRAMERHRAGEAVVIPVILKPCDWHPAPFGALLATPRDGKPITTWTHPDEALLEVAQAVRAAARAVQAKKTPRLETAPLLAPSFAPGHQSNESTVLEPGGVQAPRSRNLRLSKTFTQRDKDQFLHDAFEFIAVFFEGSLAGLGEHNPGYEGVFRRIDAQRFTATIYHHGNDTARATIFMDGGMGPGIYYSAQQTRGSNGYNEWLTVEADEQTMHLRSVLLAAMGGSREQKLSQQEAAELLWGAVIAPLQR